MIQHHELLIMMSAAHTDKIIMIFCVNIKNIAKKTLPPSRDDQKVIFLSGYKTTHGSSYFKTYSAIPPCMTWFK